MRSNKRYESLTRMTEIMVFRYQR